jgi:hypothetical protein
MSGNTGELTPAGMAFPPVRDGRATVAQGPAGQAEAGMKWSIDRKINTGFGLAVSVLIVIGIVSSLSIYRLLDTIHLLTDSHAVIDTLEDL